MRSVASMGVAWVSMCPPVFCQGRCCVAAVYARGCASMNVRRMIFLCLLVSPLASGATAPAPSPADTAVRNLGREWLEANDGVGLSIGVFASGQRQYYNFGA